MVFSWQYFFVTMADIQEHKEKVTTRQYRVTKTYLIELDPDINVEEYWRNLDNYWEFEEDEHIELIAEI